MKKRVLCGTYKIDSCFHCYQGEVTDMGADLKARCTLTKKEMGREYFDELHKDCPLPEIKRTLAYAHSDKDTMWAVGESLKLEGDAVRMFSHALCEVKFELDVNMDTGMAEIITVDGKELYK